MAAVVLSLYQQEDCQTLRTSSHSERKETVLNHHSGSVEERTRHGSDRSGRVEERRNLHGGSVEERRSLCRTRMGYRRYAVNLAFQA
jgi:hypothetical protein